MRPKIFDTMAIAVLAVFLLPLRQILAATPCPVSPGPGGCITLTVRNLTDNNRTYAPNSGDSLQVTVNIADAPVFYNWAELLQFDPTKVNLLPQLVPTGTPKGQVRGDYFTFISDVRPIADINSIPAVPAGATKAEVDAGGFSTDPQDSAAGRLGVFTFKTLDSCSSPFQITSQGYDATTAPFGNKIFLATQENQPCDNPTLCLIPDFQGPLTFCVPPPTVTKSYSAPSISVGGTSTLTITLANSSGNPAQSGIGFTDTLGVGLG